MVRRGSMLPALILALAVPAAWGFGVHRVVTDAALTAGTCEIQGVDSQRRMTQTFSPPQEPIAGVELLVSRHPRSEPLDLMIRVLENDRELGRGLVPIPDAVPMPVRLTFPAVQARGTVTIEAWAPEGGPGRMAGIQFYPLDHYRAGHLCVGGRTVRGDAAFRVLSPETSQAWLVSGLDLSETGKRFPSEPLGPGIGLLQEFVAPLDSLAGIRFMVGTGGAPRGPSMDWELRLNGRSVRAGTVECITDNAFVTLAFPPLSAAEGLPLVLRLAPRESGQVLVWLCGRTAGMGALTMGDRSVAHAMALTTLHLTEPTDSLRVVLAANAPPGPEPTPAVTGSCALTQSFVWPRQPTADDRIGLRLALGEWATPGWLDYRVRDDERGAIVHGDSVDVRRADGFLWLPLGGAHGGRRLSVWLSGRGTNPGEAARFWWTPVDAYQDGGAGGCVARPGGDCMFRLATRYSAVQWVRALPRLTAGMTPGRETAMLGLLLARWILIALGIASVAVWARCAAFFVSGHDASREPAAPRDANL